LLRTLLDAHPNVIIPWECQYIVNLYRKYKNTTQWSKDTLMEFYDNLIKQWQFKLWTIDHQELKTDLLACEGQITYGEICKIVHSHYNSFYEKTDLQIIGDKNPGYTIYIDRLLKLYPEAKFIFINRDYRANFYSIKKVDFELPIIPVVVYKWKYFYKQALKARKKHPGSVYVLNYEDLVQEPEHYFREVSNFLDIEYLPEVFDFYTKKEEVKTALKTDRAKRNHASLLNPINTTRIDTWKEKLTIKEIKKADFVAGKYAEKAGYTPEYKQFPITIVAASIPGVCYARMLYLLTWIFDKFPHRFRTAILSKGPLAIARAYMKVFKGKGKRRM